MGDHVYHEANGEGIVLDYDETEMTYRIQFPYKYRNLPKEAQIYTIKEKELEIFL